MKEVIAYEAFDGTIFDDEDDCYNYELLKQSEGFSKQMHFFDSLKKPLNITCDTDDIWYAVIKSTEAAEWWNHRCAEDGLVQPFEKREYKTGFYWYDSYEDKWKCLQEEMEKLQLMADEFRQFIE